MLRNFSDVIVQAGVGNAALFRRPAARPEGSLFRRIAARLALWQQRYRSRIALVGLDVERLRDIGLTVEDVRRETDKPFWRP